MFLAWLLHASRLDRPRLPVLLTLHGKHPRPERTLDDWPGYADSRPVRVGNGAADQHQLDGYGWVLDAAWLLTRAGHPLYSETWRAMRGFADLVAQRWREPDAGIWEIRGDAAHHVHSKLMAWLARPCPAHRRHHRISPRRRARWHGERAAIAEDVRNRGFNEARGCYTRAYNSDDLDAAILVLPLLGIEAADSPRIHGTIDAIRHELGAGGPLLYRYPPGHDGLPGTEGAFLPCAFWLVQALAAMGEVSRKRPTDLANSRELARPLGLYAEEMDPTSRDHLGNYPQALTHAALVQAALALRDAPSPQSPDRVPPVGQ